MYVLEKHLAVQFFGCMKFCDHNKYPYSLILRFGNKSKVVFTSSIRSCVPRYHVYITLNDVSRVGQVCIAGSHIYIHSTANNQTAQVICLGLVSILLVGGASGAKSFACSLLLEPVIKVSLFPS